MPGTTWSENVGEIRKKNGSFRERLRFMRALKLQQQAGNRNKPKRGDFENKKKDKRTCEWVRAAAPVTREI